MTTPITPAELSRVLALDPGAEADAAFACYVMGWERLVGAGRAKPGEIRIAHLYRYAEWVWWDANNRREVYPSFFAPTEPRVDLWWQGVEKLRERFTVRVEAGDHYCVEILKRRNRSEIAMEMHPNPAIALLRATVQALYHCQPVRE